MNRKALVRYLVTNCDCWKGKAEILNNDKVFADADLKKLKANAEKAKANELVANAARKELGIPETAASETVPELVTNAVKKMSKKKGKVDCDGDAMKDAGTTTNAETEVETEETEEVTAPAKKGKKVVENESRLTASEREDLQYAAEQRRKEKLEIVRKLVANRKDDSDRKARGNELMKLSVSELRDRLADMPAQSQTRNSDEYTDAEPLAPIYSFNGGGFGPRQTVTANAEAIAADRDDVLALPGLKMNWKQQA